MDRNGSTIGMNKVIRALEGPSTTEIVTVVVKVLTNLWFAGGNLAFVTAFITGKAFWPAVLAFLKSWYYLYKFTHGAS